MDIKRNKHLPLTETTFYTLVALQQPAHGYLIMQQVQDMSSGAVKMAAGTMYGMLDTLQRQGLIQQVGSPDGRRKTYQNTPLGNRLLMQDLQRLKHMIAAAEQGGSHA